MRRLLSLLSVVALVFPSLTAAHTIRGHSTHGHSGGSGRGGFHSRWHGGFGFYSSYYYMPSYYPYGYGYYGGYYPAYLPNVAYLDLDVSPEDAAVYVDGEYVGIADDYDGFPQYLTVTPGRHQISFKAEGHRAVTRSVRVPRGAVLDLEFTIPRGEGSVSIGAQAEPEEIVVPDYEPGTPGEDDEDLDVEPDQDGDREARSEAGFIKLSVSPPDASIYLDGRLYGSADLLSRLHGELRLESGAHQIEVVRPGYRSISRQIQIRPGEHMAIDLDLRKSGPPESPK